MKEAIKELEKSLIINPDLGIAHDVLSFAYYILGKFHIAQKHHIKAQSSGIDNPVIERKLKNVFKKLKQE
ncbi:MAG: hypothetical protein P9M03_07495 [Candidatus Theseobacter exili]|nr:hypothetical protein [Candidatus Theseobacter exili]